MKNTIIDKININEQICKEDFLSLFMSQLPLLDEEIKKIMDLYYPTYLSFISSGVDAQSSWIAIRNLFISQETQIGERIKNGSS